MERLYTRAINAKFKEYYEIKNGNHNEGYLYDRIGYFEALKDFINKCMNENNNNNNYVKTNSAKNNEDFLNDFKKIKKE